MNRIISTAAFVLVWALTAKAQLKDSTATQQAIETKNFIFKAESASPQRGRVRQLTSEYELMVRPDTATSFLPYFGRAYTAPINSEGGIKFTSTYFNYSVSKKKKHSWDIRISPKDVSEVRDLYLTVFDNGRASLRVNSLNRETISFNGYVEQGKPIAKKGF